jgi:hypothetical protein
MPSLPIIMPFAPKFTSLMPWLPGKSTPANTERSRSGLACSRPTKAISISERLSSSKLSLTASLPVRIQSDDTILLYPIAIPPWSRLRCGTPIPWKQMLVTTQSAMINVIQPGCDPGAFVTAPSCGARAISPR